MTRSMAFLFAVAGVAGTLAACGGGGSSSANPYAVAASASAPPPAPPPSPPPVTESPERLAAIAAVSSLLGTPGNYLTLAYATVDWGYMYQHGSSACPLAGARQVLVDGSSWYTGFPTGKHVVAADFDACRFAGPMQDLTLHGGANVMYEMQAFEVMGREFVSATVELKQLKADTLLPELLANGPGSYTIERSPKLSRVLVDLRPGATLTNAKTTSRIEFLGGRYSYLSDGSADPHVDTEEFSAVTLDFNGVRYLLDGRFNWTYSGSSSSCTGEIRITDGNGALVARRYCAAGRIEYEFIKSIPQFYEFF